MINVTVPYDIRWAALDWAKEHCTSYVSNDIHCDGHNTYDINQIDYFFGDEKDALIFKLKWA